MLPYYTILAANLDAILKWQLSGAPILLDFQYVILDDKCYENRWKTICRIFSGSNHILTRLILIGVTVVHQYCVDILRIFGKNVTIAANLKKKLGITVRDPQLLKIIGNGKSWVPWSYSTFSDKFRQVNSPANLT